MNFLRKSLLILAALSASVSALAQEVAPKAHLKLDKTTGVAGSVLKGKIILTFEPGLHGYQNPPTVDYQIPVKVSAPKGITLVKTTYPKGIPFQMEGEEKPSMVYSGTIEIPVEIKLPAKAGKTTLKLNIDYQQCNDTSCFPPGTLEVKADVTVTAKKP